MPSKQPVLEPKELPVDYTDRLAQIHSQLDRCLFHESRIETALQDSFDPYGYEQAVPWHVSDPLDQKLLAIQIRLDNFAIKLETAFAAIRHLT